MSVSFRTKTVHLRRSTLLPIRWFNGRHRRAQDIPLSLLGHIKTVSLLQQHEKFCPNFDPCLSSLLPWSRLEMQQPLDPACGRPRDASRPTIIVMIMSFCRPISRCGRNLYSEWDACFVSSCTATSLIIGGVFITTPSTCTPHFIPGTHFLNLRPISDHSYSLLVWCSAREQNCGESRVPARLNSARGSQLSIATRRGFCCPYYQWQQPDAPRFQLYPNPFFNNFF